jgi:hypothetical protein
MEQDEFSLVDVQVVFLEMYGRRSSYENIPDRQKTFS